MSAAANYSSVNVQACKDDLVTKYAPLVKRIAYHLISRLPPSVQPDDLIQAGMIGLLEASRNYNSDQGASFETYSGIRIRGAMLDEIRKNDWAPRSVHRKARLIAEVVKEIENRTGRDARDGEIAEQLGLTLLEYQRLLKESNAHKVFGYEDVGMDEDSMSLGLTERMSGPYDKLQRDDFKRNLSQAIAGLPERERLVMSLYYDKELNLREIGSVIGVSESRVSQIHSQAVIRLQARMNLWSTQQA